METLCVTIVMLMFIWAQRYSYGLFKDSNDLPTDKSRNKVFLRTLLEKIEARSNFTLRYSKRGSGGSYLPIVKELTVGENPIRKRSLAGTAIFFHEYGHYTIWENVALWNVGFLFVPRFFINVLTTSIIYAFGVLLSVPLLKKVEDGLLVGSIYLYWLQGIFFFLSCCLLVIVIEEILASLIGYRELKKYFLLKKKDRAKIMKVYITGLISYIAPLIVSLIVFRHWWKLG